MQVTAIEELGATRLIHGTVGGAPLTVATPPDFAPGETLNLAVAAEAVHVFDRESGTRRS